MFDTLVLGQILSDFVRVKSNVSPRVSTSTYPREILTAPLTTNKQRTVTQTVTHDFF